MEELNTVLQEFKFLVGSVVAFAGVFYGVAAGCHCHLACGRSKKKKSDLCYFRIRHWQMDYSCLVGSRLRLHNYNELI